MPVTLDLPDPEDLWAEFGALAALTVGHPGFGATVRADGARGDDVGNGWCGMSWIEGGRAVLYGYDVDYSQTREQEPPIDLLAGGPPWLPWEWLAELMRAEHIIQFVYWWDGSTWSRTDYPDGMKDGGGSPSGLDDQVVDACLPGGENQVAAVEAFENLVRAARSRSVDASVVDALLRYLDPAELDLRPRGTVDAGAMLAVAGRAGLTPGSVRPTLPAGRGEPADRRVHLIDALPTWALYDQSFETDGVPPWLCWSPGHR